MGTCVAVESNIPDILEVDPEDWNQNDVTEWIKSTCNGELYGLLQPFKRHKIGGMEFIKLTNDNLKNELEIQDFGLRQKFIYHRDKLMQNYQPFPTQTQIADWTARDVMKWLTSICNGELLHITHTFKQHKIDGLSLIKLSDYDLINELEIKSYHVRKHFIAERDKLIENHNIDSTNSTEQSSDSRTCAIFKTPNPIDEEFSDEASELVESCGKAQRISFGEERKVQQNSFNAKNWNFNIVPFCALKKLDKEYVTDYHVLQQYESYCYLYGSELVIDWLFNQSERQILNDSYSIPKEIKAICYKYYFEYEYHILQFAYDVSRVVDHIDVYYGGPLTFSGIALIDILYSTHFRKKYRLQACSYMHILIDYINELVTYGFIKRVATKRRKGIFYAVNNSFYSLQQIKPNENDIKNTLYRYGTSQKDEFDKYGEFVQHKCDRNAWSVGTIVQIYSSSGWKEAQIIDINTNNRNDIVVQYDANTDIDNDIVVKYGVQDMTLCRRVNKNDAKIVRSRPEFISNRQKWAIGTNVQVFDVKYQMWFPAKIINIIKATQFHVNASIKAARKRIKNKNAALFCVAHNALFEADKISYFGSWEANIRDAPAMATPATDSHIHPRRSHAENGKNMICFAFIRQHCHIKVPTDIINLIQKFCEMFIVWTVESLRIKRLLNCYGAVIIGPSFEICDVISFQLTLCVRDNDEHIVCYLESKYIAPSIKTLTFSLQLFCAELQHDCRGTVFYNVNKKVKCNAWSWGKTNIPFTEQLKSLNIECAVSIAHIEYQNGHISHKSNICSLLPQIKYILKNTQYTWHIDNNLLTLFKNASIRRTYFDESLLNCCWMISCEPQGINEKCNENNVYLTLYLMKFPFKTLSKCIQATYQWEVYANHTVFKSKWKTDKFKLNMKDGFHQSQQRICMCTSALLASLSCLTFKINIIINNNRAYK